MKHFATKFEGNISEKILRKDLKKIVNSILKEEDSFNIKNLDLNKPFSNHFIEKKLNRYTGLYVIFEIRSNEKQIGNLEVFFDEKFLTIYTSPI